VGLSPLVGSSLSLMMVGRTSSSSSSSRGAPREVRKPDFGGESATQFTENGRPSCSLQWRILIYKEYFNFNYNFNLKQ